VIFKSAASLRISGRMLPCDHGRLIEIEGWFHQHLPYPTRLAASRKPHASKQCLSWFRDTATSHIERARDLIAVLDAYGLQVESLHAVRPGYVVYEDAFQVVALPFADTPT
jgi:hypothetical protein